MASDNQFWLPHDTEGWLPGTRLRSDGEAVVYETELGEVSVPKSSPQVPELLNDRKALLGVSDICALDSVSDASLLHTLRVRYHRDEIYTNVSRILIAVNPFKSLNIYSSTEVDQHLFACASSSERGPPPPHIFGVAADALRGLAEDQKGQSVLVSGESGAGKTEATKLVFFFASEAYSSGVDGLGDKIIEISPVLEAFGNAKTVRNSNSSRFGKWVEVLATPSARSVDSASITDYLLEITRVCSQGPGERNYHIFYQIASDTSGCYEHLNMQAADRFRYLSANPLTAAGIDDESNFRELRKAFASLEFGQETQDAIFRIAAGVLHVGNVELSSEDKNADVSVDIDTAKVAADMLGGNVEAFSKLVMFKKRVVGKEVTETPLTLEKGQQARDAIAKIIYSRLFSWLVARCNQALKAPTAACGVDQKGSFLGVLDIAGFEAFQTNMLEQLFINLSNEKLQQFFNEVVFKMELADYVAEGIDAGAISYNDNSDVLALIEGKGGLFPMLDDATNGVRQTDATYTQKVATAHMKHACFMKPKFPDQLQFGVRHYAGDVTYTTEGFLEKNASVQPAEVLEFMAGSSIVLLRELAGEPGGQPLPPGPKGKATVSMAFRKSLQQLMDKIRTSSAHFIRCVKPNSKMTPNSFNAAMVTDQLRCSGIMEAVKIRKAGFSLRQSCSDFVKRYLILLPLVDRSRILAEAGVQTIEAANSMDAVRAATGLAEALPSVIGSSFVRSDYAIGKTKIFVRAGLQAALEKARQEAFIPSAVKVQACCRGLSVRWKVSRARTVDEELWRCLDEVRERGFDEDGQSGRSPACSRASFLGLQLTSIDLLLQQASTVPVKMPRSNEALKQRARLAAEMKLIRQIQDAKDSLDAPALEVLLARAADLHVEGKLVEMLKRRSDRLRLQQSHLVALQECTMATLESIEVAQKAVAAARGAGLGEAASWLLPQGPGFFSEAVRRVEVLEQEAAEEKRKAEEAARKAVEEKRKAEEARKAADEKRRAEEAERKAAEEEARKAAELKAAEEKRRAEEVMREAAEEKRRAEEEEVRKVAELRAAEERRRAEEDEAARKAAEARASEEKLKSEEAARESIAPEDGKELGEEAYAGGKLLQAKSTAHGAIVECEWVRAANAIKAKMKLAAADFDATMLEQAVREAHDHWIPAEEYVDEFALFMQLQSGTFIEQKIAELRNMDDEDMENLLALSNLCEQLDNIGLKEQAISWEMREVTAAMMRTFRKRSQGCPADMAIQMKIAEKTFSDLTNFSRLRDSVFEGWDLGDTKSGRAPAIVRHSVDPIKEPLTWVSAGQEMSAKRAFTNILRCMGDKPCPLFGDTALPIIQTAQRHESLCDEVYVQIMKQLTDNPSTESVENGWRLLIRLLQEAGVSNELGEFLRSFLQRAIHGNVDPVHASTPEGAAIGAQASFSGTARKRLSRAAVAEMWHGDQVKQQRSSRKAVPDFARKALELLDDQQEGNGVWSTADTQ